MRFYGAKTLIGLVVLLKFSGPTDGQSVTKLRFYHYNTSNGLGSSNVRKTLHDPSGFAWIATQDGLFRFDGIRFIKYNTDLNNSHKITGSDVRDLLFDKNILWCITSFGGLDGINTITGNNVTSWNQQNHENLKDILFLSLANFGDTLFIGSTKGLFIFDKTTKALKKYQLVFPPYDLQNININKILKTSEDLLWLFCEKQGVYVIDLSKSKPMDYFQESALRYYDCTILKDQTVACGTSNGIRIYFLDRGKIKQKTFHYAPVLEKWKADHIFSIRQDESGYIWFSEKNNLVKSNEYLSQYSIVRQTKFYDDADWTQDVYNISFDQSNSIWLSCQQGLAFSNNRTPSFLAFSKSLISQEFIPHSYFLFPINDSVSYVCATNGLYEVNEANNSIKSIDKGRAYFYVFKDDKQRTIVSNDEGTFVLNEEKLTPLSNIYAELRPAGPLVLNSHIQFGDSIYVLGTQNRKGLFLWNTKQKSIKNISDTTKDLALKENLINTLFRDALDNVWVLCDNSISILNLSKKTLTELPIVDPSSGKKYSIFFDMTAMGNRYYIASYSNGVLILDQNKNFLKLISSHDGLSNNGVYKLLPFKDSLLFITTNNGLSVLHAQTGQVKNYFEESGLHSNVFEELSGNIYKNKILAGGEKGYTVVYPEYLATNVVAPKIYISNIVIEKSNEIVDTSNLDIQKIVIPTNTLQTTVYFSGLNYSNPGRTHFSYRVKEKNELWSSPSSQNFVTLMGLLPGRYHFQVKAINEDGIESEIKDLTLIFLPKWYQTLGFKILILVIIAAIIYGLFRIRINHLKKEEKIRNQVASDLHDELGSTLNSVKVFTNLAMMEKNNSSHLEKIKEAAQSAIAGVKDIIWVLDDKRDTLDHLLTRISQFAKPICEAAGISYNQQSGGNENYKLGKEEKRNLYMIIKESINNSIKYSDCSIIEVLIKNKGGKLNITVSDNGKGFDNTTITTGYGLKNILRRSEEIGYRVDINSSAGNGTLIYLEKK